MDQVSLAGKRHGDSARNAQACVANGLKVSDRYMAAAFGPSEKWRDVRHESEMRSETDIR